MQRKDNSEKEFRNLFEQVTEFEIVYQIIFNYRKEPIVVNEPIELLYKLIHIKVLVEKMDVLQKS